MGGVRAERAQGELRSCAHSAETHTQGVMRNAQVDAVIPYQSMLLALVVRAGEDIMRNRPLSATDRPSGWITLLEVFLVVMSG